MCEKLSKEGRHYHKLVSLRGGKMIRIAIVEDETVYKEQLIEYLKEFEQERSETLKIDTFSDGDEIVEIIKPNSISF